MNEAAQSSGQFGVPYPLIARLLQQRRLALFIGAAASLVGATENRLPDGKQLAADLVKLANYPGSGSDSLAKIAQYLVESAGDRDLILEYIKSRFHDDVVSNYACSLTDFLLKLPEAYFPGLVVSTNYDTLIERVFEARSLKYVCISHILGKSKYAGRLIVYSKLEPITKANIKTRAEAEEYLQDCVDEHGSSLHVLYKMHGSALSYVERERRADLGLQASLNTIVVTEQDYIDFLDKTTFPRIPIQLQSMLLKAQFVFLGYSLADWNLRLLLHRLREGQEEADTRHWACLLHTDPVEPTFWQKRGVNIYPVSLDHFLDNLMTSLSTPA